MDFEIKDRYLPEFRLIRSTSAITRRDLERNTLINLPQRERNLVSRIKSTLEESFDKDLRMGVRNIQDPSPRPQTVVKTMIPRPWPPDGFRSIGINDRVKSSHGRYSGNITDASLCTCDRTFRSQNTNLLSIQFCDILGPYACADCTRKRKVIRLHDAVIPPEMDDNAFTPLGRMEHEAANHQKKLLDRRRRNAATACTERTITVAEENDKVSELPTGFSAPVFQKRRGTIDMLRSLVRFTRYATSFATYKGDITKVAPPLAKRGAHVAETNETTK
ncbi:uncharacterized protein LOC135488184 [Lineus longissimus]|uniref:uncharacterized protein LOC135488184 n=1 Tax=Lineus longissimus TaxID=88925 RepID=UPI002B4DF0B1